MKKTALSPRLRAATVPVAGASGAWAIVPPPLPAHVPVAGAEADLYRAHEALAHLQTAVRSLPQPALVTRTLDRREAVRSSQIEGSRSNLDQLLEYEATGSDEGLPADVRTTHNYVTALDHGLQQVQKDGGGTLTVALVQEIHRQLMTGEDSYRDTPGQLRSRQNWIGGFSVHEAKLVPPPPEHVLGPLTQLMQSLASGPDEEVQAVPSIISRLAMAHAQFELIHPFLDGNGRVGRILLPLMLVAEGYPPVYLAGYLKANQSRYYELLGNAQLKEDWAPWVRFMALAVTDACQDAISTAQDLAQLRATWQQRLSGLRRNASALHALDVLLATPVITVNSLKSVLGVSFPAANGAIEQLLAHDIVTEPTARHRNRVFVAGELVARLNQPHIPDGYRAPRGYQ